MEFLNQNKMNKVVKEKCRNVAFCVPESLIEEIDDFCLKNGGVPRKEWFYKVLQKNDELKLKNNSLRDELHKKNIEYINALKKSDENHEKYLEVFRETKRYRTFWKRLRNLFKKY